MKDFVMREVSICKTYETCDVKIEAIRTRTSNGFCSIALKINDGLAFRFHTDAHGSAYEIVAARVASMLTEITDEPCLLPPNSEESS